MSGDNSVKRVLFLARPVAVSGIDGYHTQVIETKAALGRLGVQVDLLLRADLDFTMYDIVHIFSGHNVWLKASYFAMKAAKEAGVPIAISTIYIGVPDEGESWAANSGMPTAKRAIKYAIPAWLNAVYSRVRLRKFPLTLSDYYHWHKLDRKMPRARSRDDIVREMFLEADILLPNSHLEMESIKRSLGVENKYQVVPNCTDLSFADAEPDWFVSKFGVKDFVMCAAYFCKLKNQLALIRAMKGIDVSLVLAGNHKNNYGDQCRKGAGDDVVFTGSLSKEQIASAYAAAKIHVLPSYYETTGIASMEAGLAGCTIVAGNRGATREYFGDFVHYCDPASEDSIRSAILKALEGPPREGFKEHIMENFTWDKAGQQTLEGYKVALARRQKARG